MGIPGGRDAGSHRAQGRLQVLIFPLRLTISLRVVTGAEAYRGSQDMTECLPHLGGDLGAPVQNYVLGDAVKPKNMNYQKVGNLWGRRNLQ